nr:MAG TPA: hypothetical protein [Bacteriophage sp.]
MFFNPFRVLMVRQGHSPALYTMQRYVFVFISQYKHTLFRYFLIIF